MHRAGCLRPAGSPRYRGSKFFDVTLALLSARVVLPWFELALLGESSSVEPISNV
jgi:hypothetical protein